MLVALRRTGGLFRTRMELPELIGAIDADTHEIPAYATLNRSLGRLNAAGLVAARPQDAFKLTREGRQLLASRHVNPASQTAAVALLLDERDVPLQNWILNSEVYARAVADYRRRSGQPAGSAQSDR